jgi:hypothetical protein
MTTGNKFLDEIGIITSFREIETDKVTEEYGDEYTSRMASLLVPPWVSCLELFNPRTNVTEQFFFNYNYKIYSVSVHLLNLIVSCHPKHLRAYNRDDLGELTIEKLRRLFGNDFPALLHYLLVEKINKNEEINFLAEVLAEIPEASKETIRLILLQDIPTHVEDKVMKHPEAKNLMPFR